MLSTADQALVRRDARLPGLAVLLDDDRLSAWLATAGVHRPAQRADAGPPVRARGRALRYKPGTSCVLYADVTTDSGDDACLIWAYPVPDDGKAAKLVRGASAGAVLAVDRSSGLVATTGAGDRALPALGRLLADPAWRERLLRRVLPGQVDVRGACLHPLRHNPGRRWVARVDLPAGPHSRPVAVLRVYASGGARAAARAISAWGDADPRTPGVLGRHLRREVLAVEFLRGTVLPAVEPMHSGPAYRAAGVALGRLHSRRDVRLRRAAARTHALAEAERARQAAGYVGALLPDLRSQASALGDRLAGAFAGMEAVDAPVHGDFSADQAVLLDDGRVGLIDLDGARRGDPAVDLACAAAALACQVSAGRLPAAEGDRRARELRTGYAEAARLPDDDRLAVHEAAHLLRRAVEPFRLREADWPAAAEEMLARAQDVLSPWTPVRHTR